MQANKKPVSVRFDPRLLDDMADVIRDLGLDGGVSMDLSTYVRYMMRFDAHLWRRSPYVALSSRVTALVGAHGRVALHRVDRLRLNRDVASIPFRLSMKQAKVAELLDTAPPGREAGWIRDRWRVGHFELATDDGRVLDVAAAPVGLTSLAAELRAERPAGTHVIKRTVAVIDDYVRWFTPGAPPLADDALEIDITMPTIGLDLCVVVDRGLFRHTRRFDADFVPRLEDRLLGSDGQRLDGVAIDERSHDSEMRMSASGRWSAVDDTAADGSEEAVVRARLLALRDAVHAIDGGESAPAMPQAACYHRVRLARARMGLKMSVRWPRPERALGGGQGGA